MKCPNCGSEHIQYATKTSGGGFSFGNSCCGYILLGPLGLLCGACGSGTHTEEFWICQDCGTKFSNWSAQQRQSQENAARIKREQDEAKFLRYKDELSAIQSTEGDYQTIRSRAQEMNQRKDRAKEAEDAFLKKAQESADPTMKKLAKIGKWSFRVAIALFVLCIVFFFVGAIPVSVALLIASFALLLWWSSQTDKARAQMKEYDAEFCTLATETDTTKAEAERLRNLVAKIDFVERYRP